MDIAALAKDIAIVLSPFLPYLLKLGDKAAEEAAKKLGGNAWEGAKALWARLRPKVDQRPALAEALQDAHHAPDDVDAQAALRVQLRKLLAEDADFAEAAASIVRDPSVRSELKIDDVLAGGEVTGIDADNIDSGDVDSYIEAKRVAGQVTGISVRKIGGKSKD